MRSVNETLQLPPEELHLLAQALAETAHADDRRRVQALLWLAEGRPVPAIAQALGVTPASVRNWRRRYLQRQRIDDLYLTGAPSLQSRFRSEDLLQLEAALPHVVGVRPRRRLQAVLAVARGERVRTVAQAEQVSHVAVRNWVSRYLQTHCVAAFTQAGRGAGRAFQLDDERHVSAALQKAVHPSTRQRLQAVLYRVQGLEVQETAVRLNVQRTFVTKWVYRYLQAHRVEDLLSLEPKTPEAFRPGDTAQLEQALQGTADAPWARRLRAVLSVAQGVGICETARRLQVHRDSVGQWVRRFLRAHRIEDLQPRRPGRQAVA